MSYYYLNESNQPVGPLDLSAVRKLAETGIVADDVLVCETGSEDWTPLSDRDDPVPRPTTPPPPRTAPPPRSGVPPRRYTPPTPASETGSSARDRAVAAAYPEWFPLVSMIAGIVALVVVWVPGLSVLLAAPALALGILGLQQNLGGRKPLALGGIVTAAVALVVSLGILLLGLGDGWGGSPEAAAIEKVLNQDQALCLEAKSKFPNSAAQATRHVAERMQQIDTSRCPPEFRLAFQQHVNAWRQSVPYIQADTPVTAFFEGLYAGATDDYSVLGLSSQQARLANEQVNVSYREVLNVAAVYGARIPGP